MRLKRKTNEKNAITGMVAAQARQVVDRLDRPLRRVEVAEHRERAERHDRVDDQIEKDGGQPRAPPAWVVAAGTAAAAPEAKEHVARVGDARISHQSAEVVLQRPMTLPSVIDTRAMIQNRSRRLVGERRARGVVDQERGVDELVQAHQPGDLGDDRQQRHRQRRGAFVDVRRIEVERGRRQPEARGRRPRRSGPRSGCRAGCSTRPP